MRIHLADASSDRGQLLFLLEESYSCSLFSYAYICRKRTCAVFETYWNELVRIHLADTTARLHGNQSVKTLLPDEQKTENLFSYAYQEQEEQWRDSWNHAMNIHLAGLPSQNSEIQSAVLPQIESHLTTYADTKEVEAKERAMNIHLAGHSATPEMENTVKPDHDKHLTTYSDQSETVNTVNDSVNRVDRFCLVCVGCQVAIMVGLDLVLHVSIGGMAC